MNETGVMKIRIGGCDYRGSTCDGPGIRTVVFLQGCDKHCPGCHNEKTWDPCGGEEVHVEDLIDEIAENTPLGKVTISGGEPLLQPLPLLALVRGLAERGFDIALYTGCELKDVPREILAFVSYVKSGPFVQSLRSGVLQYVGSSNQKFTRIVHEERKIA